MTWCLYHLKGCIVRKYTTVRMKALLMFVLVIVVFSCSDEKDMRKEVIGMRGYPDILESGGGGAWEWTTFYYLNAHINLIYDFRKSNPGCGGDGEWYVEQAYPASYYNYDIYEPPTIKHSPVLSAPEGQVITIGANITDDEQVVLVELYYRQQGQEEFSKVEMAINQEVFSGKIPASVMTPPGIDYYILASDGEYPSQMPERDYLSFTVSPDVSEISYGNEKTSYLQIQIDPPEGMDAIEKLVPRIAPDISAPLSP